MTDLDYPAFTERLKLSARLLDNALRDRYEAGFERTLARTMIGNTPPDQHGALLMFLIWYAVTGSGWVEYHLDECDEGTYAMEEAITGLIQAETLRQRDTAYALESWLTDRICAESRSLERKAS